MGERELRVHEWEMYCSSIEIISFSPVTKLQYTPLLKPLSAMNVTTVHGNIGMDYITGNYGCRECPVPLSHRYCSDWIYDPEGER